MNAPDHSTRAVTVRHVAWTTPFTWLKQGWRVFLAAPWLSLMLAAGPCAIGVAGTLLLVQSGLSPMIYAWAGGFMLVGPALLCGYFQVAERIAEGQTPGVSDYIQGLVRAPLGVWAFALSGGFLLFVWFTDAAVIYTLSFGARGTVAAGLEPAMPRFLLYATLTGAVLALIVFAITAFAVPLLYHRRAASLASAVVTSVRAVRANLGAMMLWGGLLAAGGFLIFVVLPPAFLVTFPVIAYASHRAYRDVCPSVVPPQ